ncbi:MAG: hypothetical protein H6907_05630 [Hyphomicrobiales bacterium]|nr:hypothetical protein [Hyphomicrobiales bacterium]MCP5371197.1 hypothetical protein [Hyphomicrobiales bacterium]
MGRVITFLSRNATVLLAVGVLTGLALPALATVMRPLLAPSVWGLLVIALLRVDLAGLTVQARRPALWGAAVVWILLLAPVIAWIAVGQAPLAPGIAAAVVLMAGTSPMTSSPALAMLVGLNGALALLLMVVATALMPFILPLFALHVLDLPLAISPLEFSLRLAAFIASALVAALAGRALWRRRAGRGPAGGLHPWGDAGSVVLLLVFAVGIMQGVAARLLAEPAFILGVVALAFAGYGALLLAGTVLFRAWGQDGALTVGFISANRNMAILLAVLPADVDPDVTLYLAIGQIPMYVMPALLLPLYRRIITPS